MHEGKLSRSVEFREGHGRRMQSEINIRRCWINEIVPNLRPVGEVVPNSWTMK